MFQTALAEQRCIVAHIEEARRLQAESVAELEWLNEAVLMQRFRGNYEQPN